MKKKNILFRHILSYLSMIILSLCILTVLFAHTEKDTETLILEQYDDRMHALVSNFENQVESWGGVCYSIFNNNVFKSYVDATSAFGEFELVSMLRGYEGSIPLVSEIIIYNKEAATVITGSGKLDADVYFRTGKNFDDAQNVQDKLSSDNPVGLDLWEIPLEEDLLVYVYPISRVSPYRTKQEIYILLLIAQDELDSRISNITGNLNGQFEIYQRDDRIYSNEIVAPEYYEEHIEALDIREYLSSTGLYRFVIHIYPSELSIQLKSVQSAYSTALICLIIVGVLISVIYGMWSSRPYKHVEQQLDSAHNIIRQQVLSALLSGMQPDEDKLRQAGLHSEPRRYSVAIVCQQDITGKDTDKMLTLVNTMPAGMECSYLALEYDRAQGVVIVLELPSNSESAEAYLEKLYEHLITGGSSILICAGGVKNEISQLCNSFGEASYLCSRNSGKGIICHELDVYEDVASFPITEYVMFTQALQTGNESAALKSLDVFHTHINSMQDVALRNYTYSKLLSSILRQAQTDKTQLSSKQLNALSNFLSLDAFWSSAREAVEVICSNAVQSSETSTQDEAKNIMQYISDNSLSYDIGLEQIAEKFNISMNRVSMLVKKSSGRTFREYLINLRMEVAEGLLRETDDEIQMISNKVGYTSVPHFIKTFKGIYGLTPAQYRKSDHALRL